MAPIASPWKRQQGTRLPGGAPVYWLVPPIGEQYPALPVLRRRQ